MYNKFLVNVLPNFPLILPLELRQKMGLQQDGALPHYSLVVPTLNQQYPENRIGRDSALQFPPRSPDLNCMDYYLWGRLKNIAYARRPTAKEDIMNRIRDTVASISGEEIQRSVNAIED